MIHDNVLGVREVQLKLILLASGGYREVLGSTFPLDVNNLFVGAERENPLLELFLQAVIRAQTLHGES